MRGVFGVALVALLSVCVEAQVTVFPVFPPGFGDSKDPAIKEQFVGSCRNACTGGQGTFIARCTFNHPYACNLYVECLRFGGLWVIYGRHAPVGDVYDERDGRLKEILPSGIPDNSFCLRVGHPCASNRPIPEDASQCGGFMTCVNNTIISSKCPEGRGFSAWTGACDLECDKTKRRLVVRSCGPSLRGQTFFQINETVTYGDGLPTVESLDTTCPASTSYQVMGKCGCDHTNETAKGCETTSAIHLSSSDNSWELAKNNTPMMDSSSIEGNADIVKSTSNDNPRSAFFSRGQSFVAPRLDGNDLGLYFDLAFTFQAVQSDNTTRGVLVPSGTNGPLIIALVDNSAKNQEATYGCRLQVVRTNFGQVQCYVRPSKASDSNERYDANATSPEVDLRRRVSVVFAKDNTKGKLSVTAEGSTEQTTEFLFEKGIRAVGNSSPLAIASGTGKRDFTGYMDDMFIKKYCGSFM
ncbi:uncharacterized protein [Haliotis cracherodii]|uniref:uncharacterized protein n=1 Tax=Haliotis cracherodii TaxID=6455 RepID=UPI0039E79DDE